MKKTILFIGDSITDVRFNKRTKRLKAKEAYPLQVVKQLNNNKKEDTPFFRGIASNRSWHVYDRFTKDCIDLSPDYLVLFIGVNDAWTDYKPENYKKRSKVYMPNRPFAPHFDELIRRLKTELPMAKVLILSPFLISTITKKLPFKTFLLPYISHIKEKAAEAGYSYINLQSTFDTAEKTNLPSELSVDGIHPTTLGHSFIAKEVLAALQQQ